MFINIDLSTLENHPGMARVIIGAFLKAIYNRNGDMPERALFLLDEAARLGYMRIIETARDAGRKYGVTLLMLFQSLGQMREAFGGRDATSKWFESASWVSFSAINDPETAEYISKRCGTTTVEVGQLSRTSRDMGSSRTRSMQLSQRPLILPHEVTQMRADEQIVLTSGNPPLRCGRAVYFRRPEMLRVVGQSNFGPAKAGAKGLVLAMLGATAPARGSDPATPPLPSPAPCGHAESIGTRGIAPRPARVCSIRLRRGLNKGQDHAPVLTFSMSRSSCGVSSKANSPQLPARYSRSSGRVSRLRQ
ncbi:type IV secretory pathway TraG/TraD family ATPase VirD4 [Aquamicrobium terrae]|uniref:Type IV secretory pathway TraG/TraD family ATPase VirD4 n=1 Tax=Aquamicrobium terrae TaxID=1324945 RepID=A0ABV2N5C4_9HYPH